MKPCHWALWLGLILPSWVKSQPSPLPLSNTATAVLRAYLYPNLNFLIPTPGKTKNKLINSVLPSRAYTHMHRPRANTCTHMHTLLQHYTKLTAFATEDAVLFFLLHRRPCPSWVSYSSLLLNTPLAHAFHQTLPWVRQAKSITSYPQC